MTERDLKSLVFAEDVQGVDEWLLHNPRPSAFDLNRKYLGLAIARNNLQMVKVLVIHGEDVSIKNKKGRTCLQKATRRPVADFLEIFR
jgi:ankyrin repeat protein